MVLTKRKIELFWTHVNKNGPLPPNYAVNLYPEIAGTRCWLWEGQLERNGYGRVKVQGKGKKAHRIAWQIKHGFIPKGKKILHKCDNRACVRHLFLGTMKDNSLDMVAKNRFDKRKGENTNKAKLSNAQVLQIRRLYAKGDLSQRDLSAMFGVTRGSISPILQNKTFTHI
jgi:predicted XRE-type DNA-binding protein